MSEERVEADSHPMQLSPRHDPDRDELIARTARMTADERVELFERLSADAAWIRATSRRIR